MQESLISWLVESAKSMDCHDPGGGDGGIPGKWLIPRPSNQKSPLLATIFEPYYVCSCLQLEA